MKPLRLDLLHARPKVGEDAFPNPSARLQTMAPRSFGTVLWWNSGQGVGRIASDAGGEFWAHFSGIRETGGFRALQDGQRVEFTAHDSGPFGPADEQFQAWDIVPVTESGA